MVIEIDWDEVVCCYGCVREELPEKLVEIIEELHEGVRDANGMNFTPRENYGLRSTQIIALVVMLYKRGCLR